MTIFLEDSFDAAHWLPNVPDGHKCKRLHGHTYRVRLEVTGEVGAESGWVMDYADLKSQWDALKKSLDHRSLNEVKFLENPTCERIAEWLACHLGLPAQYTLSRIELRETEHCGVVWQA